MTRPINPARTITAPYAADHPPPMPERIRALLGKRASDLTRRDLLDIAADAANRDAWDLCGDREHVGAICDLAGTLEAEIAALEAKYAECVQAMRVLDADAERHVVELEAEHKAHAATRDVLEVMLGAAAPAALAKSPTGAPEPIDLSHWPWLTPDQIEHAYASASLAESSLALETLLTTGPDEPGPHDATTVDCALDDDETRVATDEEMRR